MTSPSRLPPTPSHHVPDHGLVEYAAATCTDGAALAFACHLSLCPACAADVTALEQIGGDLLEASPGAPLDPAALAAVMARLDGTPQIAPGPGEIAPPAFLSGSGLPAPLLRALSPADDWRTVVPGVRKVDLRLAVPGGAARLVRFQGGVTIPLHDHGGPEYIVVFTGALEEKGDGRRFVRGDLSIRLPGEQHAQRAAPGEPCVALVVNEGALRPLTLRGRLLLALARG